MSGTFCSPPTTSVALKPHRCFFCNEAIPRGGIFVARAGKTEGDFWSMRAHPECEARTATWDNEAWETFEPGSMHRPMHPIPISCAWYPNDDETEYRLCVPVVSPIPVARVWKALLYVECPDYRWTWNIGSMSGVGRTHWEAIANAEQYLADPDPEAWRLYCVANKIPHLGICG